MRRVMTAVPIWQVSLVTDAAHERFASECLARFFAEPVCSYDDFEQGRVWVSVYCRSRPASKVQRQLAGILARKSMGGRVTAPRMEVKFLRSRDWANAWKRHFQPISVGRSLLIKPSWSRKLAAAGQRVVVLDPGLSFGTGHHPTTRFCLEQVVALRPEFGGKSFLDVGTGSGILAIAARKLGYDPVGAMDHDPVAVRIAEANARRNRVQFRIWKGDVAGAMRKRHREEYDVVCANLTQDLLIDHARKLAGRVRRRGCLILAGILGVEFERVRATYEAVGWRLMRMRKAGEWQSGAFVDI